MRNRQRRLFVFVRVTISGNAFGLAGRLTL